MKKIFSKIICGILVLAMTVTILQLIPGTVKAEEYPDPVNGHRDIFSTVEAGEKPEGWSGGEWSVAIGETAIDNWGAELTSWNHFLKYDSGSRFFVYDKEYTDFDYTTHMQIKEKGKSRAVVFRYKDENNYYYYQLTAGDNLFEVGKVADGEKTVLAEGTAVVDTAYRTKRSRLSPILLLDKSLFL